MITLPVMKLSRMPMHKLSAVGHHRVGFTSKEEEQGLHEQDTIRGDVRHGTETMMAAARGGTQIQGSLCLSNSLLRRDDARAKSVP